MNVLRMVKILRVIITENVNHIYHTVHVTSCMSCSPLTLCSYNELELSNRTIGTGPSFQWRLARGNIIKNRS